MWCKIENGLVTGVSRFELDGYNEFREGVSSPEALPEKVAKEIFSETLQSMGHDFGDGRVIQVRPPETGHSDESNIRNAIERMVRTNQAIESWFMKDNTFHDITAAELQAALESGQDQTAAAWATFRAAIGA